MIENLIIDILRLKYPAKNKDNTEIYFYKGRFRNFRYLLEKLEEKKTDFRIDTDIIEEFIRLVKSFKSNANANAKAHSIIMIGEEKDLLKFEIKRMIDLGLKLKNNIEKENEFKKK